ncbi:HAD family phosphatase, partial [Lactococcus lactis]
DSSVSKSIRSFWKSFRIKFQFFSIISPEIFYDKFREATNSQLTDEIIEKNWNLILKDFQKERMDLLTELS